MSSSCSPCLAPEPRSRASGASTIRTSTAVARTCEVGGSPSSPTVSRRQVESGQVGQSSHEKGAAACDGMRAEGDLRRYDRPERCNAIRRF
jgi:hypothetical protein